MSRIKVAVAQISSTFSVESTLLKISRYIDEAVKASAQLIVFPEATIGGYPKLHNFDSVIGERSPEARSLYEEYVRGSITVPGPAIDSICEMSRMGGVFIVIGVIERSCESGTLYCTAVFVDPQYGFVGKHRKVMPTGMERVIWGQGDGSTLDVFRPSMVPDGIVSATICWENYMPLLRQHYYTKMVNLYCAPTVDSRDSWPLTMTHIALEGRTFVLSACQYARRKDFPGVWRTEGDPEEEIIKGGSMIIGPLGEVLAGPMRGTKGVLVAEIDLGDCIKAKYDLDVVGHYARYELRCYYFLTFQGRHFQIVCQHPEDQFLNGIIYCRTRDVVTAAPQLHSFAA